MGPLSWMNERIMGSSRFCATKTGVLVRGPRHGEGPVLSAVFVQSAITEVYFKVR